MRVCPVRAHPPRGAGPNMVRTSALFPCQTAATDTSVSPDWAQNTQYTYGGPHLSKCSVALTLNLLYGPVKECALRDQSMH